MSSRRARRNRFAISVFAACAVFGSFAADAAAQAGERELHLGIQPRFVAVPTLAGNLRGPGAGASVFYGLSPSWSVGLSVSGDHLFARASDDEDAAAPDDQWLLGAFAGPAFNVDILRVVPWIHLAPGVWRHGGAFGEDAGWRFGLRGAIGADWRYSRRWAFGAAVEWHAVWPEPLEYPVVTVFALRVTHIFETDAVPIP